MANPPCKRIDKPGFLLIEIMCAFLFMIITGSIMAFYVALGHTQQQSNQNRLTALLIASEALDHLRDGNSGFQKCNAVQIVQVPTIIAWSDGTQDQVWIATVHANRAQADIDLKTVLPQKAL